jgi:5'-nucleotidase
MARLLISNDDGIFAKGLFALAKELKNHFEIAIVAPDRQRSGTGIGLTLHRAIGVEEVALFEGVKSWKTSGKPADCVKLGLSVLLDYKPDMIVSGINQGSNSGRNALYSGTVGAAMEGAIRGIPAIAFSSIDEENPDYEGISPFTAPIIKHFLKHPMPIGTVINVNFPNCKGSEIKGVKYARQGMSYYGEKPYFDSKELGYYISKQELLYDEDAHSDITYLSQNYISAVPISVKELTEMSHFNSHKELFEKSLTDLPIKSIETV